MVTWAKSLLRTWTRWTYLVNGCNPARIDDPEEQRRFLQRIKKSNKGYLYVIGSLFILLSPIVVLIGPGQLTLPEILAAFAAGFATFALGVGALIWAWRS